MSPLHNNQRTQSLASAQIETLSHDGRGIARLAGKTVFISGALPGEVVEFCYISKQRRFDEGKVVTIIQAAPERISPRCPHFGVCGGCNLQHLPPEQQIAFKQSVLLEHFTHIGKVSPDDIAPPLQAAIWGYRHKARIGVRYVAKKQTLLVGFREQHSNFITELTRCEVLHPAVGEQILALREMLYQLSVREKIAQIEIAVGEENQAAFVFRNLVPLPQADLTRLTEFAQEKQLYFYLQPGNTNSITPLYPADLPLTSLIYRLPEEDIYFRFAPSDFTQINPTLNRLMVAQALTWLAPEPEDSILDLFCGLGNFTLALAKRTKRVVGVEGDESLVERARMNAREQGIDNTDYHVANLAAPAQSPWLQESYDKIMIDPPRSGALEIIQALPLKRTKRIVYVSCNPATLARDAGELVHNKGFRLVKAGVMDMFPHTAHLESMALFEKNGVS